MTLLIVDMQPYFDAANHKATISNIVEEIEKAKKQRIGIVILEFSGYGPTHAKIKKALVRYSRVAVYQKCDDDGSVEARRAAKKRGFDPDHWRVCGVNTDCCVAATVTGLLSKGCKVDVVCRACNSDAGKAYSWDAFKYDIKYVRPRKFQRQLKYA